MHSFSSAVFIILLHQPHFTACLLVCEVDEGNKISVVVATLLIEVSLEESDKIECANVEDEPFDNLAPDFEVVDCC